VSAAPDVHWLLEPAFWQGTLLLILIFSAAVCDALTGRIPNAVCIGAVAGGFLLSYLRGGLYSGEVSLASSALACGIGAGAFLPFYLAKGLGSGDVKVMAGVGALAGQLSFILWSLANTALAGVPLALAILIWRGTLAKGLRQALRAFFTWRYTAAKNGKTSAGEAVRVPYAMAICAGVIWTIWLFIDRQKKLPFF